METVLSKSFLSRLTKDLLTIFIVSLVLGQLGRLPLPGGIEGGVYLNDLILGAVFSVWFLWRVAQSRFMVASIDVSILSFLGIAIFSLIFASTWASGFQLLVGAFYLIRIALYFSLYRIVRDVVDLYPQFYLRPLLITGTLFAVLGIVQYAIFPDFSSYAAYGWDPHYYRVLSTFFDPNFSGLFLVLFLLFLLKLMYDSQLTIKRVTYGLLALLVGATIVFTFSRSSYLAFAVGVGLFSLFKDRRILIGMAILSLLAFATIPRVRTRVMGAVRIDETAQIRLKDYKLSIDLIKEHPVFGVGFNTLRYAKEDAGYFRDERGVNQPSGHAGAGADNSFLFVGTTMGVLGVIAFLGLFGTFLLTALKSRSPAVLVGVLGAIFIHTQFVNSFFYTWIIAFFLVLFGVYGTQTGGKGSHLNKST